MMGPFLIGFAFSFVGSLPPGTLNISIVQLALANQQKAVLRFALAAGLVEFPYALIAVKFEQFITANPFIIKNFQLIAAVVMVLLGVVNLWPSKKDNTIVPLESGFRKGVLLSVLNPLAIPFWIGITAYLRTNRWLEINNQNIWFFVVGISLGTMALLALLGLAGSKVAHYFIQHKRAINAIPGFIFLALGLYAFVQYFSR